MTNPTVLGVVGTDGIVPIYRPADRWSVWHLTEIWQGGTGAGKYVPKVDDLVVDITRPYYSVSVVDSIDPVTLIPHLQPLRNSPVVDGLTPTDVLFGVGPGTPSDTYRLYLDTTVYPHVLAVDARLKIAGTMSRYAKIFQGVDAGNPDAILSRLYDSSGAFMTDQVPLELVAIDDHTNYAIRCVGVCHTHAELPDGELVMVVCYNDEGHVVSKRQLLVENTSFIRSVSAAVRYITHISLECPFFSATEDRTIAFPLNVPVSALNPMGVVHYSTGEIARIPDDGTKFSLYGLDQYISTIIGQRYNLVLAYHLGPNESTYSAVTGDGKYITEAYQIQTINPNHSYTVKLIPLPYYVSEYVGYRLNWYLYTLDRNIYFDVTNQVTLTEDSGAFDPVGYGYMQHKTVTLNLREVSPSFKPFVHVQSVDITLRNPPNGASTPWRVLTEPGTGLAPYGDDVFLVRQFNPGPPGSPTIVRIAPKETVYATWLDKVYYRIYPLFDPELELKAPEPTHVELIDGAHRQIVSVDDWNQPIVLTWVADEYATFRLRWYKESPAGDIELASTAMVLIT
ncbi:MAG: hypothetical protein ACR2HF_04785 [Methylococcaceae bacterium]